MKSRLVTWIAGAIALMAASTMGITAAGAAAPTYGIASSVEQIRPTTSIAPMPTSASVTAARNESESFQIVVQGPASGISVSGDLYGWGTTFPYAARWYDATEPSDGEGGTGRWADALVPKVDNIYHQTRNAFPLTVPAGEVAVIWVDLFVPLGTAAGQYSGNLTLSSSGGSVSIPVNTTVLGFDLPTTSSVKSAFYLNYDSGSDDQICLAHTGSSNCGGNNTLRRTLYALYSRMAIDNRVTLANGSGLRGDQSPTAYGADWESIIEAPTIRGVTNGVAGSTWRLTTAQATTVSQFAYANWHCSVACVDEWEAEANEAGQSFADKYYHYGCDEPNDSAAAWAACGTQAAPRKAAWADRPLLTTASIRQYNANFAGSGMPEISVLVPPINRIHDKTGTADAGDNRAAYTTFLATAGHEVWLYASCLSNGCDGDTFGSPNAYWDGWPGYAIDEPANQARAMGWMLDRYSATGELYWAVQANLNGAWNSGGLFRKGVNGDGTLFYPGTTTQIGGTNAIPLESIRLKRIRDGYEDYEYMKWLRDHGRGADVASIVNALYPTAYSATAAKDGTGAGSLLAARDSLVALVQDQLATSPTPEIAFSSNRDGNFEIYTMTATGTGVTRLTTDPAIDRFPAWNPSGTKLAWTRGNDIWIANADGTSPTNLTGDITDVTSRPAFSGDGSKIVFVRTVSGHLELWTMSSSGASKTALVNHAATGVDNYDPAVSTSGDVYFSAAGDIYRVNLNGTALVPVVTGATVDEVPDFGNTSAKGLSFSRSSNGATPYDVVKTSRHGGVATGIAATGANELHGSWSPNDSQLAVSTNAGGDAEIAVVNADGSNLTPITTNAATDVDPDWRTTVLYNYPYGRFSSITPARLLDSRSCNAWCAPLGAGATGQLQVTGRGGVPAAGVTAVAVNVTAVKPTSSGYLTVWQVGVTQPTASNLNFRAGVTRANAAVVPVSNGGKIQIFNSAGTTDVLVDVVGYFGPVGTTKFSPLTSTRLLDSRSCNAWCNPLGSGATGQVQISGRGGIPATGVSAAALNLTAVQPTSAGYLTMWQSGVAQPYTSNVNFRAHENLANSALAPVGTDGKVQIYNSAGSTDALVDSVGFFGSAGTVEYTPVTPARLLDSRGCNAWCAPLGAGATGQLQVTGRGGLPTGGITAVILNITAVKPTSGGYLTVWQSGVAKPKASNVNFTTGVTLANSVVVPVGPDGKIQIYNSAGSTDVLADVVGYFG